MSNWFADMLDSVGTTLNLPELGWSEGAAGNKKTNNTGRVAFSDTGGWLNTPSSPSRSIIDSAYGANQQQTNNQIDQVQENRVDQTTNNNDVAGGSGSGASATTAADLAYLDDQKARLDRQMGSTNTALKNGLQQLLDSYNSEVSSANSQRSRALEDFATKREDTTRAKDSALNKVDMNAKTLADSLRRRIGLASGSGSSAYQITAPGAVANQASTERGGVQENYGVNFRNLATAEDRAKVDFEDLLKDLLTQKSGRERDFRADILDKQNQITNSLSEVARQKALLNGGGYNQVRSALSGYSKDIDSRQSQIDNLFSKYRTPFDVKQVQVQNPNLRDYTVDGATIDQQTAATDPYAEALRKRQLEDDEEYGL